MGGMQTINIGLCECLDLFSAFGAFSAAPTSYPAASVAKKLEAFPEEDRIRFFYSICGTEDGTAYASAAAAAKADFHAVMEMQPGTLHRTDEPVVPVQGKDREICRKLIIPVFRKDDPRSGHGAAPPVMLSAMQQNHYTPHGEK